MLILMFFFFQAEDGIRDVAVTGVRRVLFRSSLKPGDRCPHCQKGKVYHQAQPGVLVRVVGQAALKATVYELEKLRCNLCRSEERRVGKSVDLGGRRIIKKKRGEQVERGTIMK